MSDLTALVDRLASQLGAPAGSPEPLEGGITNRNYRVTFGKTEYVLRVPGRDTDLLGIDRTAEGAAAAAAARIGIGPPVAARLEDPPCLVSEFVPGSPAEEADLQGTPLLDSLAGSLRGMHDSGERLPTGFSAFAVVRAYEATARGRGGQVPADYDAALDRADLIEAALSGPEHDPVPCHNDLLAGNLLVHRDRICIVDWEYAAMGDRYFDLGNLAVNNGLSDEDGRRLLEAYFGDPPDVRRLGCLALMRFMSDFREAMWGVVQSTVSELDFDFDGYARTHFHRLGSMSADPRFDQWLEEADAPHA